LIDEPGKGLHWVRQSGKVGHLIIEQVKDGAVLIRDGQRTFEQTVPEKPKKRSLLKGSPLQPTPAEPASVSVDDIVTSEDKSPHAVPTTADVRSNEPALEVTEFIDVVGSLNQNNQEEIEMFNELIDKLKQQESQSDKTPEEIAQQSSKLFEEFVSQLESTRISPNEAQELDRLGKQLHQNQQDPNQAKTDKVQRGKASRTSRRTRKPPEKE
jgi:hypothetical protein